MATAMSPEQAPPQEIEAKFRVSDQTQLERLRTESLLAGRYPLGETRRVGHVDTYFDTKDWRLLRAGQTLRTRADGDTIYVTVKSVGLHAPKGLHTRDEIELPAPGIDSAIESLALAQLPEQVRAALEASIDPGEALLPLARLNQARSKRMLSQTVRDQSPLAELSIDDVSVLRPDAEGWKPVAHFHEVEIELVPGAERRTLKEVALAVRELPGVAVEDKNKLQKALAALADASIFEDTPADHSLHVAELCRRVWKQQLAQMLIHEAGVRFSKDIEFVHEMRVATRRARAAARLYAGFFERKNRRIERFVRTLRTTGRLLGRVRDMDVALDKLERFASERDHMKDKGYGRLRRHWKKTREKAHASLLDWLDSPRYATFVTEFGAFCDTFGDAVPPFNPRPGEPPQPIQVRHVIPSQILNRYEVIRAFEVLFEPDPAGKQDAPEVPVETLHALRIECKYLRYHLEFNAALLGPEGGELIASLKALQEHLGDLNDASVSALMLDEAGKHARGDLLHAYRSHQDQTIEQLRTTLPTYLSAFLSDRTRRTLTRALARI